MVKNLLGMQETQVWSLGGQDPLEKEMATHSSLLAWEIHVHGVAKSSTWLSHSLFKLLSEIQFTNIFSHSLDDLFTFLKVSFDEQKFLILMKSNFSLCFPGGQWWRIFLPVQEAWVWCLGWEDLLNKEMATHSTVLAWEIPWAEEPSELYSSWAHTQLSN